MVVAGPAVGKLEAVLVRSDLDLVVVDVVGQTKVVHLPGQIADWLRKYLAESLDFVAVFADGINFPKKRDC